jgi:hypothetical protein
LRKEEKTYYSKDMFMVNDQGIIVHKIGHTKGRRHDYNFYKKNYPVIPSKQVVNVFDLGYLGIEKDFLEQLSSLPYKRKRNHHELSQEEKEYNKIPSNKKRIAIENIILFVD